MKFKLITYIKYRIRIKKSIFEWYLKLIVSNQTSKIIVYRVNSLEIYKNMNISTVFSKFIY